jgi:hypothetical protein
VSTDGGDSWSQIDSGLPDRWITRVTVDPYADSVAYVALSGHRIGGALPHIYRTANYGQAWESISSDLPEAPVNDVIVDPMNTNVLYIGSDVGVYMTTNLGANWTALGTGLPITTVHDLCLHQSTRKLVAGTHGRSMFSCQLPPTDTLRGLELSGADSVQTINAAVVGLEFYLRNSGMITDTFQITVSPDWLGWYVSPQWLSVELPAGQTDSIPVSVSVPYDAVWNQTERITLKAVSQGNPYYVDSMQTYVTVGWERGDVNSDHDLGLEDVIFLLNYLFKNGDAPPVPEAADANCDGIADLADAIVLLNYLFRNGPLPCAPSRRPPTSTEIRPTGTWLKPGSGPHQTFSLLNRRPPSRKSKTLISLAEGNEGMGRTPCTSRMVRAGEAVGHSLKIKTDSW